MSESEAATDQVVGPTWFMSRSWRAEPTQLTTIRADLRRWLASVGLGTDAVDDVVLAVNEAVSNVIDHAYRPATGPGTVNITLQPEADSLRIDVVDHGRWRTPSVGPTGRGRGIAMMNRLVDAVLIHYDRQGTHVVLYYPLG